MLTQRENRIRLRAAYLAPIRWQLKFVVTKIGPLQALEMRQVRSVVTINKDRCRYMTCNLCNHQVLHFESSNVSVFALRSEQWSRDILRPSAGQALQDDDAPGMEQHWAQAAYELCSTMQHSVDAQHCGHQAIISKDHSATSPRCAGDV